MSNLQLTSYFGLDRATLISEIKQEMIQYLAIDMHAVTENDERFKQSHSPEISRVGNWSRDTRSIVLLIRQFRSNPRCIDA